MAALAACLTDPPPDLPLDTEPPIIQQASVKPPVGLLTSYPTTGFEVPVQLSDPNAGCVFSVFDEYNFPYLTCRACGTPVGENVVFVDFGLGASFDPTRCHTLRFTVASSFSPNDNECQSGSETIIWEYRPDSASCDSYDAGSLGDGAFPDASTDGLPFVPDSGDEL